MLFRHLVTNELKQAYSMGRQAGQCRDLPGDKAEGRQ